MNETQFVNQLKEINIEINEEQLNQFRRYFELLVEWNEKINLTSITEQEEVYLKHFYDCILSAKYFDYLTIQSLCDIGGGAGFPSIPLKIIFPHLQITVVDSLNKRINFLNTVAMELELEKVRFIHGRAEDIAHTELRASFDAVTARAVARLSVLSELCIPFVKKGGYFITLKGDKGQDELKDSQHAFKVLGIEVNSVYDDTLPVTEDHRMIGLLKKKYETPKKYPRKAGTPNKKPL